MTANEDELESRGTSLHGSFFQAHRDLCTVGGLRSSIGAHLRVDLDTDRNAVGRTRLVRTRYVFFGGLVATRSLERRSRKLHGHLVGEFQHSSGVGGYEDATMVPRQLQASGR